MFAASKTGGVVTSAGDPYWTSVSLLTNFENNLSFQDGSTNNFAITRTGVVNPSLNTPFSGVGGSEWFNGASDLSAGSNAAFAFGTGAYTVECWVYLTVAVSGTHNPCFVFCDTTGGFGFYNFGGAGQLQITARGIATVLGSSTTLTANVWNHIVAVRSGTGTNLASIFVNGTRVANGTDATNWTVTGPMRLGSINLATYYLNGFMSNVRVVKGTAVYDPTLTTLTVPTAPLTAIANTSLLITGTGQGMFDNATFVDQGPNALTVTATGSPVYSGLSPFGNTYPGSVLLNGTSQYVTAPDNATLNMGTSDFTLEAWIYLTATPSASANDGANVINKDGKAAVSWAQYNLFVSSALKVCASFSSVPNGGGAPTAVITGTTTLALNTWYHVAVTRIGVNGTVWVNGTSNGTTTSIPSTLANGARALYIGYEESQAAFAYFPGYISNARVVKGTAVYTANFTPSTTPLTAITNTSLLVRGDTGAFYDLSNVGNPESGTGSVAVTTQVKKFGNESGSFSGVTTYISAPNATGFQFGSGDFTVEMWLNTADTDFNICGLVTASTGNWMMVVVASQFYWQTTYSVTNLFNVSAASILNSAWHHIAISRSGTSLRVFFDGVQQGSSPYSDSTSYNGTGALRIGSGANGDLNGYLDDIRITKGVARYTANFTPPTATFPTGP
jgi:hypothetical protein